MMTRSPILSSALALLAFGIFCPPAAGISGTLRLDGIVHVSGMSMSGARMVIVNEDGHSEVVVSGLEHFSRELPLQTAFLIGFEREGCVTKQLYFDTHVPAEAMAFAPFDFPFEVTLEKPPHGQNFHYAGPVGYIRYFPEQQDFGYDTDYKRIADPKMATQMLEALHQLNSSKRTTEEPQAADPVFSRIAVLHNDTDAFNVIVPTRATRESLVHPSGDQEARPTDRPQPIAKMEEVVPPPAPVPTVASITAPAEPVVPSAEVTPPAPLPVVAENALGTQREEELIVEPQRIIKIVRLTRAGTTDEYRRVQHKYGAVFFFRNGSSCTQYVYELGIGDQ